MTLLHGMDRDAAGAVSMTATGTIIPQNGKPLTAIGELRTTVITGAPPGGSVVRNGVSFASDGSLQVTTDSIGLVDKGVAYTANRVVCHTTNAPSNSSRYVYLPGIGTVLVDSTGLLHVS